MNADRIVDLLQENERLKKKVGQLMEERQRLINDYMRLKFESKKKKQETKSVFFDLISEYEEVSE